ncbi:MAG TPA: class I SAM-dependent methyltransferase [Hyphomicrobiales bacterium]|nr:class I SAM-dependent methyltransferase [Hyphomicrobiales bacterium]
MPPFSRVRSALRYLAHADPFYKWRVHRASCPNCKGNFFLSLRADPFMTRCLSCLANATNLSLIPVIQQHSEHCRVETAWEMSTYGATLAYLKRQVPRVYESEFFPGIEPGHQVNGILNQDVQNTSFADDTLDLITSNQVFEHVEDDVKGFRECHRILKPGGALICSLPLYDLPATQQLARISHGKIEHLAPPEYHDSRRGGPGSALCFWRHSFHDIIARVASVGFSAKLIDVRLPATSPEPTLVVYARKPVVSSP